MRRLLPTRLLACPIVNAALSATAGANTYGAGFMDLALADPVEGGPMPAIVVYPAQAESPATNRGPFTIDAAARAAPAAGPFPLIVISHGTGGSLMGHPTRASTPR